MNYCIHSEPIVWLIWQAGLSSSTLKRAFLVASLDSHDTNEQFQPGLPGTRRRAATRAHGLPCDCQNSPPQRELPASRFGARACATAFIDEPHKSMTVIDSSGTILESFSMQARIAGKSFSNSQQSRNCILDVRIPFRSPALLDDRRLILQCRSIVAVAM